MNNQIVILDGYVANSGDLSWDGLSRYGELVVYERTSPEQIVERCSRAWAVLTNKVALTAEVISAVCAVNTDLRYIGEIATGYNNIDVAEARRRGITVCNVPAYSTMSVAQTVFALLLAITNRVETYSASVAAGEWSSCADFSYRLTALSELDGQVMGVYGLGNIGSRVAMIAHALGMKVISPTSKTEAELPPYVTKVSLDEMFAGADVVSLNAPLTAANTGIINARTLALMKPTAILINTARGGLVNEADLAAALRDNRIAAAGLDVLATEPPAADCPLIGLPNCFVTPHVAWQSTQARRRLLDVCIANVAAYVAGRPQNVVGC